jgi:hypothetical protein
MTDIDMTTPLPRVTPTLIDSTHWQPMLVLGDPGEKAHLQAMTLAHLVQVLEALTPEQRDACLPMLGVAAERLKADKERADKAEQRVRELEAELARGSTFNSATRSILGRAPRKHATHPCTRREWCALICGHAGKCAEDPPEQP